MKKRIYIFILISLTIGSVSANQYDENTLKSVFIEKFTRFIEWPSDSDVINKEIPFRLGVYGDTPMLKIIDNIYSKEPIQEKKVEIIRIEKHNIFDCDLLLISNEKEENINEIIEKLKGKPILTIGESSIFAKHGAMISYKIEDNRIKFIINQRKAAESGFRVSYHLLNLAEVIEPVKKK